MKAIVLLLTHLVAVAVGFALGIYLLPILTAPDAPAAAEIAAAAEAKTFSGRFRRDLEDSDALHWGEGDVYVGRETIALDGEISPGPAYKLYLAPQFVETERAFEQLKPKMVQVGDIKTFKNFVVSVPSSIDPADYDTVIVWCESFGEFITAAQYR